MEALRALKPAFRKGGSVTAGNSSGMNDGAAALVIASEEKAAELGATPLAAFRGAAVAGVDPRVMGIGPIPAVQKLLARTGVEVGEIDLVELNEAFASQSLAVIRELGLDPDRVNVNGGAIAVGHPLGMSGARLVVSLVHELRRRGGRWGWRRCVSASGRARPRCSSGSDADAGRDRGSGARGADPRPDAAAAGIESVVIEDRSRDYVEQRIRAGVLEQGTADHLRRIGAGERMDREGAVHHGIELQFDEARHRIDLTGLTAPASSSTGRPRWSRI